MISCPAAKQIRCVNPSIATVSPSRTSSRTASRIVATLPASVTVVLPAAASDPRTASCGRSSRSEHAELVALGVLHDRPVRVALLDQSLHGGARRADSRSTSSFMVDGGTRSRCNRFLTDFASGTIRKRMSRSVARRITNGDAGLVRVVLLEAERRAPEVREELRVVAVDVRSPMREAATVVRRRGGPPTSAQASSKIRRPVAACSRLITSGGDIRIVESPARSVEQPAVEARRSRPRRRSRRRRTRRRSSARGRARPGSAAAARPAPAARPAGRRRRRARCPPARLGSGRSWRAPPRTTTGFPPYVEPCAPIAHVIRSARAIIAPSGMPLAMPLPASTMSGSTPQCSTAHIRPVRPMPLWTSSATNRMPCSVHRSRRYASQPSGGTM